ncbi:MAG: TlpA disulfide reductase family protein [Dongiaceae bacterium]
MSRPKSLKLSLAVLIALAAADPAVAAGPPLGGTVSDFTVIDPPRPAPATSFVDRDGGSVSLADFRGKVVLLNLWATWCGPCVEEMPSLDRLEGKLGGADFEVLALAQDQGGRDTVAAFYRRHRIERLALYADAGNMLAHKLGIDGLPTTLVLDREGRAVGALVGAVSWDTPEALALLRYYIDGGGTAPAPSPGEAAGVIKTGLELRP